MTIKPLKVNHKALLKKKKAAEYDAQREFYSEAIKALGDRTEREWQRLSAAQRLDIAERYYQHLFDLRLELRRSYPGGKFAQVESTLRRALEAIERAKLELVE